MWHWPALRILEMKYLQTLDQMADLGLGQQLLVYYLLQNKIKFDTSLMKKLAEHATMEKVGLGEKFSIARLFQSLPDEVKDFVVQMKADDKKS